MASGSAPTRRVTEAIREAWLPLSLLVAVIALVAIGYLLIAHRVTGAALGYSLRRATNDGYSEPCHRSGDDWYCANGAPEGVAYRMTVKGHCWRARSVDHDPARFPYPRHPSGCVGLADQVRLREVL
jgi:hypothetical protein